MQITVQLPSDLAQHPNPGRDALEALAIEGYRSGALSVCQTRLMLGFETRYDSGWLIDRRGWTCAQGLPLQAPS
jgi:hypothetical protein